MIEGKAQGKPADVWSLGCSLLEMLSGIPPWSHKAKNSNEIKQLILSEGSTISTPLPIAYIVHPPYPKKMSDNCKDFLDRIFTTDPEQRPTALDLDEHPFIKGNCCSRCVGTEAAIEHVKKTYSSGTGTGLSN